MFIGWGMKKLSEKKKIFVDYFNCQIKDQQEYIINKSNTNGKKTQSSKLKLFDLINQRQSTKISLGSA